MLPKLSPAETYYNQTKLKLLLLEEQQLNISNHGKGEHESLILRLELTKIKLESLRREVILQLIHEIKTLQANLSLINADKDKRLPFVLLRHNQNRRRQLKKQLRQALGNLIYYSTGQSKEQHLG